MREKGMFLRCGYVVNRMDSFSLYVSLSIKKSDRTLAELFDFAEIIAEESTDPIIVTERTLHNKCHLQMLGGNKFLVEGRNFTIIHEAV